MLMINIGGLKGVTKCDIVGDVANGSSFASPP